jgi:hypothetical protein
VEAVAAFIPFEPGSPYVGWRLMTVALDQALGGDSGCLFPRIDFSFPKRVWFAACRRAARRQIKARLARRVVRPDRAWRRQIADDAPRVPPRSKVRMIAVDAWRRTP